MDNIKNYADVDDFREHPEIIYNARISIMKYEWDLTKHRYYTGELKLVDFHEQAIYYIAEYSKNHNQYIFYNCTIENFSACDVQRFYFCYFYNCKFTDVSLEVRFDYCIFENCTFVGCKGLSYMFNTCKISNVKFEDCNIDEVDLCNYNESHKISIGYIHEFRNKEFTDQDMINEYLGDKTVIEEIKPLEYSRNINKYINNLDLLSSEAFMLEHTKTGGVFEEKRFTIHNKYATSLNILGLNYELDKDVINQLFNSENIKFKKLINLPSGKIKGYKLVAKRNILLQDIIFSNNISIRDPYYLAELEIPEDAKRSVGGGVKCRCSKAKVIGIKPLWLSDSYIEEYDKIPYIDFENSDDTLKFVSPFSQDVTRDDRKMLVYTPNTIIHADYFDNFEWEECSGGIHFFTSLETMFIDYYNTIINHNGIDENHTKIKELQCTI